MSYQKGRFWIVVGRSFVKDTERFERWGMASVVEGVRPIAYGDIDLTRKDGKERIIATAVLCEPIWRRANKRYLKGFTKLPMNNDGIPIYFPPNKDKA